MNGIIGYGAYIPYFRLERSAIAASLGTGGGRGPRAVASYDEDTTSMGVEAARTALAGLGPEIRPDALLFATAAPAYLDKTNATAVHAALGLDGAVAAYDVGGAARSTAGALRLAAERPGTSVVVAADVRTGLPGGSDEANGGDAAAALVVGSGDGVIAELLGVGTATAEFLDRWRIPGAASSGQWEERFAEPVYVQLAQAAVADALKQASVLADEVDHLVVGGLHSRAARVVRGSLDVRPEALSIELDAAVGNTGAAHLALGLAEVLDRAEAGDVILAVSMADGADAFVLRVTEAIEQLTRPTSVAAQVAAGNTSLAYATFLTWRGFLHREPPRRPEPDRPAAPPSFRAEAWKFTFVGSRCEECGTRHLPPQRVCLTCNAVDRMVPESLAGVPATIATYTVDRLAYSLNPPSVVAVIDFDGGGRFTCELTDVDPASVRIGDRVELTFRRLYTSGGVHNYFWKARPIRGGNEEN